MSSIPFTKMHGLGNNYVYIDCFKNSLAEVNLSDLAKKISDVNTGIGSDGIILICPSKMAHAKMRIFNKDGSEGLNCGNGLRCVAKYLYDNQYVKNKNFTIETLSGIVDACIIENTSNQGLVLINMGSPKLKRTEIPMLGNCNDVVINEHFEILNNSLKVTCVSMGNPHAVFFVDHIHDSKHLTLGPQIECDRRFPQKINVEFASVNNSKSITCKVWERGSGETKACGTGACAVAIAAILNDKASKNSDISIHLDGGTLLVNWTNQNEVLMTGPATLVAHGEILI